MKGQRKLILSKACAKHYCQLARNAFNTGEEIKLQASLSDAPKLCCNDGTLTMVTLMVPSLAWWDSRIASTVAHTIAEVALSSLWSSEVQRKNSSSPEIFDKRASAFSRQLVSVCKKTFCLTVFELHCLSWKDKWLCYCAFNSEQMIGVNLIRALEEMHSLT